MATSNAKMSKQDTAGKGKHVTLTAPQKPEIGGFNCGKSLTVIIVAYNTGSSTVYAVRKQMGQSRIFDNMAPVWSFNPYPANVENMVSS